MEVSDAFRLFFKGLARHAPGSDESTLRALNACDLPESPVVYDMGAGTGASTLVLAESLQSKVVAVDLLDESLEALRLRAERRGIDDLVETRTVDFSELDIEDGSVDLIWSEGAIYHLGWAEGLRTWRPLLKQGGYLVASDCVWLTDDRPDEAVDFWAEEYPGMTTTQAHIERARDAGFEVVETFELPRDAWADYYGPLRQRAALVLGSDAADDMQEVAEGVSEEVRIWEEHGHTWNYVFFVLRRPE
jgi:serine/threonine-protein kinase HipA